MLFNDWVKWGAAEGRARLGLFHGSPWRHEEYRFRRSIDTECESFRPSNELIELTIERVRPFMSWSFEDVQSMTFKRLKVSSGSNESGQTATHLGPRRPRDEQMGIKQWSQWVVA